MWSRRAQMCCVLLGGLAGCGVSHGPDAGPDEAGLDASADAHADVAWSPDTPVPDAGLPCTEDLHCDDGDWCTGEEYCRPRSRLADSRGCVHDLVPCAPGDPCDATFRVCDWCPDADGDGYRDSACGGEDCDDRNRDIVPGRWDPCDGLDHDCDGRIDEDPDVAWYPDPDGDGYAAAPFDPVLSCAPIEGRASRLGDCNGDDPSQHPGAIEACDGRNTDCDGRTNAPGEDDDGDGYISALCTTGRFVDCDDHDPRIHPGRTEVYCDGIDQNCDGWLEEDDDGDGESSFRCGGHDCNDRDPSIGAPPDVDGDGHLTRACGGDDCDDTRAWIYAGAPELCDGLDSNCDGVDPRSEDRDRDGYSPIGATCLADLPGAFPSTDCWDDAADIEPGRPELCDGLDNDCDPATLDGSAPDNGCLAGHPCMDGVCRQTVALAAVSNRTCAVLVDGSSRCWGSLSGRRCTEPDTDGGCYRPFDAWGWTDIVALDERLSFAVDSLGQIWNEQLRVVASGPHATAVSIELCVVRADTATVWCVDGGDLAGPTDVVQLVEGCARTGSGAVWCWGTNVFGEVGDGTTTARPVPVRVIDDGVTDLAATSGARCAVRDGELLCWGSAGTDGGRLHTVDSSRRVLWPSLVPLATGATEVAASWSDFAVARGPAPTIVFHCVSSSYHCWGELPEPGSIEGSGGLHGLVIGDEHGCGFTADGRVACFGSDRLGRLGAPYEWPSPTRPQPVIVGGL